MRAELARLPRPLQSPGSSDPEQVKKLAALGYISASTADLDEEGPCPRRATASAPSSSSRPASARSWDGAIPRRPEILAALLEQEPGMTDVWQMYSEAS